MMPEPRIFDVNPEEDRTPPPFDALYRKARQHFCFRLWKASGEDHFAAALFQSEDVWFRQLIEELIMRTWYEVAPDLCQIDPYIKAAPALAHPHEDQQFVEGGKPESPEEAALFNVYVWIYRSLWTFWDDRFEGPRAIVVRVTRTGIAIKGILPIDVAQTFYQEKSGLPMISELTPLIYNDARSRRPTLESQESSDPPF